MQVLNREQEKKILEYLITAKSIGSGAARTVFIPAGELEEYLNEIIPALRGRECVIKVCIGSDGWRQNRNEIEFYTEYQNLNALAEIFAYGVFVEIMERVESIADITRTFYDAIVLKPELYLTTKEGFSEEETQQIMKTIYTLIDLCGDTSDNGQLGFTADRNVVAFDYGYTEESDECLCSDYDQIADCRDSRIDYLQGLINILDVSQFIEKWDLLDAAESWLQDYYGDYDDEDDEDDEDDDEVSDPDEYWDDDDPMWDDYEDQDASF